MPRAYSPDLRHRIVQHTLQATPEETATLFQVNPRTVRRFLNLKRLSGNLNARVSTGRTKKLDATVDAALVAHCDAHPDDTLEQYQQRLKLEQHVNLSISSISRALKRLGRTRKKRRSTPANAIPLLEPNGEV